MSKNLIVSMACGEQSRRYAEITFPMIQKYAQKCGADFYAKFQESPTWNNVGYQKWDYQHFFNQYDRILHIDADMVVRSNTPDLFKMVPEGSFAAVNEGRFQSPSHEAPFIDRFEDMKSFYAKRDEVKFDPNFEPSFYVNVGLFLFDRNHTLPFFREEYPQGHFKEQTQINYYLNKYSILFNYYELHPNFNYMSIMENAGLPKEEAFIVHYAGNYRGYSTEQVIEMMKKDIH